MRLRSKTSTSVQGSNGQQPSAPDATTNNPSNDISPNNRLSNSSLDDTPVSTLSTGIVYARSIE